MKNNNKTDMFKLIFLISLAVGFVVLKPAKNVLPSVYAEESEEEEHEEREDNHYGEDDYYQEQTTQEQVVEPTPAPVRYVTSIDPGFNIDTDKDGLVDAIDPDPTIPQTEFFTDSDQDGVPNAFDKYKNEDDFKYVVFQDDNHNGILDSLEQ